MGEYRPGRAAARSREDGGEGPIELRRHLDALRRSRWLIASFVILVTGAVVGISLVLPKTYTATATLMYDPSADPLVAQDSQSVDRQLATLSSLITGPGVLQKAAAILHATRDEISRAVKATPSRTANLIGITASARKPVQAQRYANTVADVFLSQQRAQDLERLRAARAKLQDQLSRAEGLRSAADATAIRARLSQITVSEASAGSQIRLAEGASLPKAPSSPRPIRNGILAFFASIFLGVLVALGRDQLVRRVGNARELTRITEWPVLAGIPFVRRRFGRQPKLLSAPEHEAYQTLQAALRFQLPPTEQHVIAITSAREGEGKTTVTANLGRALARAGRKTLLISGDMRKPKLHERFGLPGEPGLAEVLTALDRGDESLRTRTVAALRSLLATHASVKGNLHILPGGRKPADPARLLLGPGLGVLLEEIRKLDYDYVLLDGTPLIGLVDSQSLVQRVDDVIVVTRLDWTTEEDMLEVRELLDRMDVGPIGHVVVGVRRTTSSTYYYAGETVESEVV